MKAEKRKVLSNQQVSERYWHMIVDASDLQITAKPGQFFNVLCGESYYPLLRRPLAYTELIKTAIRSNFFIWLKGSGPSSWQLFRQEILSIFLVRLAMALPCVKKPGRF